MRHDETHPFAEVDGADAQADAMAEAWEQAGRRIEDAMSRAALSGELDFRRMTDAILQDLARLAVDCLIARPLENLLSDGLSRLPFMGGRAAGGPVLPGGAYLVGEHGPEVFTPATSGAIEPSTSPVTVNIQAGAASRIAGADRVSARRLARSLARAVQQGGRRL